MKLFLIILTTLFFLGGCDLNEDGEETPAEETPAEETTAEETTAEENTVETPPAPVVVEVPEGATSDVTIQCTSETSRSSSPLTFRIFSGSFSCNHSLVTDETCVCEYSVQRGAEAPFVITDYVTEEMLSPSPHISCADIPGLILENEPLPTQSGQYGLHANAGWNCEQQN